MNPGSGAWLVLACALLAANLPFLNERLLLVGPRMSPKRLPWRCLELLVWCAATLLLGTWLEVRAGQRHPQGWEFFAAFGFLFLTFAFPGFVWRYLRRGA